MEKRNMDVQPGTQELCAPILPENGCRDKENPARQTLFSADKREIILALCMYPAAYVYLGNGGWQFVCFCALFCAMTEWLYWDAPRSRESWFWLGCLMITAIAGTYGKNRVWGDYTMLFTHAFAVYWVLCRSGRLLEGESGHLLPLDAFFGLIVFPFKHFFLRLRTVGYAATHWKSEEKRPAARSVTIGIGVLLSLGLLYLAVQSLSGADMAFAEATERLLAALRPEIDSIVLWRVLASLPIGAYLFGLIAGTRREEAASVLARGRSVNTAIASLRRIPALVWAIVLGVFALLYLLFFGLQASYLFGAFARMIPDGFTVAEYARQGFFSLCRVMAVNFALLWLVTRTCARPVREDKALLILCAVLLCQSLVFAAIAASKLYLYISSFGFTPRRFQSAWLIGVLSMGCVCALCSLLTQKKTFRYWLLFSAAALTLLSLY